MKAGFGLLSHEYLQNTNFIEWTNRFKDVLDVGVIKSEKYKNTNDTAFVKFCTRTWDGQNATDHFYEGTWQTIKEDGVYKMLKADITEVNSPDWNCFYN